jgi:hypothetical protein
MHADDAAVCYVDESFLLLLDPSPQEASASAFMTGAALNHLCGPHVPPDFSEQDWQKRSTGRRYHG